MSCSPELLKTLQLPENANEEDVGAALLATITSAARDENPGISLHDISHLIHNSNVASLLDPLNTFPILLPSKDPAAREITSLLSECSPAKEVVMAVQEAVERIEHLEHQDDDAGHLSPQAQLITLIDVYASAIPRLKPRRKTASETVRPLLFELEKAIQAHGDTLSIEQGRSIIDSISNAIRGINLWVKATTDISSVEHTACNTALMTLLSSTLATCAHCIHSCIAQRTFESLYPRLVVKSVSETGWKDGEQAVQSAIEAANAIGYSATALLAEPSTGNLILLAHSNSKFIPITSSTFEKLLSTLLYAFHSGIALDECLALLLTLLHERKASILSPDTITPLCTVLSSVASTHADPAVRHQSFRITSLLLSQAPQQLRLEALKVLTTDSHLPQMRTASVGLVKEAVLEGLSSPSHNIFASRIFLQVFGPILFRSNPPEYLSKDFDPDELRESYEATRLIECLSFYYVLLQRDQSNKTGVRDRDVISNVEKTFLAPLRSALSRWMGNDSQDVVMPLISLEIGIERVDSVIATLNNP
ncbi:hypothetical protein AX17_003110 [Amanita inopinata Kibby_2008]|nr:hypothetical protein AX17_003110 [Amanita inopinata Kibby_2008]